MRSAVSRLACLGTLRSAELAAEASPSLCLAQKQPISTPSTSCISTKAALCGTLGSRCHSRCIAAPDEAECHKLHALRAPHSRRSTLHAATPGAALRCAALRAEADGACAAASGRQLHRAKAHVCARPAPRARSLPLRPRSRSPPAWRGAARRRRDERCAFAPAPCSPKRRRAGLAACLAA